MKAKKYSNICKSTTSGKDSFYRNLILYYQEQPIITNFKNENGDSFVYFNKGITKLEKEFETLVNQSIERRDTNVEEYISSGYVVSEINSSLRAEGVNTSRKQVDIVIKNKLDGKKLNKDEITKLITNYFEALNFIISGKEITERNIFTLYSILTADLDEIIEPGSLYRKKEVYIGEDKGMDPSLLENRMKELIAFIQSNDLEDRIQTKAIMSHYIFENMHPYYDYNGRMGRLLHLWVLINHSREEFWKLIFLSESIYAYKEKLDSTFRRIVKAKKSEANIDLTYFIARLYEIFNDHTASYIEMKDAVSTMKKKPSRHLRLFIIDLLNSAGEFNKWNDISEFKRRYPDYSKTVYDRTIREIKDSGIFDIREGRPIQFRLKKMNKEKQD